MKGARQARHAEKALKLKKAQPKRVRMGGNSNTATTQSRRKGHVGTAAQAALEARKKTGNRVKIVSDQGAEPCAITPAKDMRNVNCRLNTLAALTATPVRSRVMEDPNSITPKKLVGAHNCGIGTLENELSPLSKGFPSQCKRRRTAAAMAATLQKKQTGAFPLNRLGFGSQQRQPQDLETAGFELLLRASQATPSKSCDNFQPQFTGHHHNQFAPAFMYSQMNNLPAGSQGPCPDRLNPSAPVAPRSLEGIALSFLGEKGLAPSSKWLEVVVADQKGRLAALRRSRQRVTRTLGWVKEQWSSPSDPNAGVADLLMRSMEGALATESAKLEKSLKQIMEVSFVK